MKSLFAQVPGCTDTLATNFESDATINNGSCIYPNTNIVVEWTKDLPVAMEETSGLIFHDNQLITHNDINDTKLYLFSPDDVNNYSTIEIQGVTNFDWEEIAQDEEYIYIGDFGNNGSGSNRTDLKIYRIKKIRTAQ